MYNVDPSFGGWKRAISRPDRSLQSVILDTNVADKVVHFGLASRNQIRRMFIRFYPDEEDLASKFAEAAGDDRASMAMLQGFFLGYKNNPLGAYENVQILLNQIEAEEEAERKRKEAAEEGTGKGKKRKGKRARKRKR